ncbi:hypothetical protein BC629DRAFT_1439110 [Irpex lacteus]|nr:hypothetical protein BC629DRAFT_1439110 [Irpex lacteus]
MSPLAVDIAIQRLRCFTERKITLLESAQWQMKFRSVLASAVEELETVGDEGLREGILGAAEALWDLRHEMSLSVMESLVDALSVASPFVQEYHRQGLISPERQAALRNLRFLRQVSVTPANQAIHGGPTPIQLDEGVAPGLATSQTQPTPAAGSSSVPLETGSGDQTGPTDDDTVVGAETGAGAEDVDTAMGDVGGAGEEDADAEGDADAAGEVDKDGEASSQAEDEEEKDEEEEESSPRTGRTRDRSATLVQGASGPKPKRARKAAAPAEEQVVYRDGSMCPQCQSRSKAECIVPVKDGVTHACVNCAARKITCAFSSSGKAARRGGSNVRGKSRAADQEDEPAMAETSAPTPAPRRRPQPVPRGAAARDPRLAQGGSSTQPAPAGTNVPERQAVPRRAPASRPRAPPVAATRSLPSSSTAQEPFAIPPNTVPHTALAPFLAHGTRRSFLSYTPEELHRAYLLGYLAEMRAYRMVHAAELQALDHKIAVLEAQIASSSSAPRSVMPPPSPTEPEVVDVDAEGEEDADMEVDEVVGKGKAPARK